MRRPDVPIVGDCRNVIERMIDRGEGRPGQARVAGPARPGSRQVHGWQTEHPLHYDQPEDGPLKPQYVIEELRDHAPEDTILASGVGQHQMWASQHWRFEHPYTWVNSGGLGTMGFSVPAAIGAKVGMPEQDGVGGRR